MVYGSIFPSEPTAQMQKRKAFSREAKMTGLQFGKSEDNEMLWIGSCPHPKSRSISRQKSTFQGQYFVLDAKSKQWLDNYVKPREFVIQEYRLQNMNEPLAPFFLQYKGRRVDQVTVPWFEALIISTIWKEDRQMLGDEKAVEPAQ
ncbi:unnamed protein product [Strongylus vulgaris]|uniref:Uncharacterized protein n=1 Tax=Strongylus vulgaris TaxID=40348 RepID=A0A3P7JVH6_STRVU|nr:unnamed protein product [Strongylus vulgaris]